MHTKVALYLKAKQTYYFGTPIMSDPQFDALEAEIRAFNPNEPALALVGGPLPKSTDLALATHKIPMGSQEKVDTLDELTDWVRRRKKAQLFQASYKADGNSVGLYYEKGKFIQAITKGQNGTEGEDITNAAALFQHAPLQLKQPWTMGIRCEAVLTHADWKKADSDLETNPRNVAAGILGRLDVRDASLITALAFDLEWLDNPPTEFQTESEKTEFLISAGFQTPLTRGGLTLEEVAELYETTRLIRDEQPKQGKLPYWIDGIVVKLESLEDQDDLGITDGRPKGQIAWKFPSEKAITTLLAVIWQVGNTGAITPVGHLKPVRIGGSTVTKASLANAENVRTLGAFIGAEVEVAKCGDIIPGIIRVLNTFDPTIHTQIEIPTNCPECGGNVEPKKNVDGADSVVLFCANPECECKTLGRIKRFCVARNILGIGDSIVESLVNAGEARSVPDLYRLTPEKIENLRLSKGTKLGLSRATSLCDEIKAKATTMSLPELIGAFGVRSLAKKRPNLMIEGNPELENLERWFDGSLLDPEFAKKAGVPKSNIQIAESLKSHEATIRESLEFITLVEPEAKAQPAPGGKVFCITGTLPSGKKKKDYAGPLTDAGHILVDEVRPGLDYLVVADPDGKESSKTQKAKKLGIPLINEASLLQLIATNPENTNS